MDVDGKDPASRRTALRCGAKPDCGRVTGNSHLIRLGKVGRPLARSMPGRERRFPVQLAFTSNCPPEMLRLSGMPIKIKDRPFKFGTRL